MKALSHYLAPLQPGRGVLLWGGRLRALAAAAAAWGVARGAPVWVVDAANRFDPYGLVQEAAGRGLSPQEALTRVRVARAFTSHQLVRLLHETFPAHLAPGSLVLVLGPVSLFYDEQVPLSERRRLFQDLVRLLAPIKTRSALLLLQPLLPRAAANQRFGRLLAPVMDYFVKVESREDQPQPTRRTTPAVPASASSGADAITPPPHDLREETFNVNVSLPECPYLHPGLKLTALFKQWSQTLATPGRRQDRSPGNPEISGNPGADSGNRGDHADGGVNEVEGRPGESVARASLPAILCPGARHAVPLQLPSHPPVSFGGTGFQPVREVAGASASPLPNLLYRVAFKEQF